MAQYCLTITSEYNLLTIHGVQTGKTYSTFYRLSVINKKKWNNNNQSATDPLLLLHISDPICVNCQTQFYFPI